MRHFIKYFKDTVIGGIFFLIPIFVILIIVGKIWQKMTGVGKKLADFLGTDNYFSFGTGPIITGLLIVFICFTGGLLLRLSILKNLRDGLDKWLCKVIPGYEFYRVTLEEKLTKHHIQDSRPTVIVTIDEVGQAGVVVEEWNNGKRVIFVPSNPGTPEGQVYIVDEHMIKRLTVEEAEMNKILKHQGKGMGEWF
jgi:uncharacterized membrane protein